MSHLAAERPFPLGSGLLQQSSSYGAPAWLQACRFHWQWWSCRKVGAIFVQTVNTQEDGGWLFMIKNNYFRKSYTEHSFQGKRSSAVAIRWVYVVLWLHRRQKEKYKHCTDKPDWSNSPERYSEPSQTVQDWANRWTWNLSTSFLICTNKLKLYSYLPKV